MADKLFATAPQEVLDYFDRRGLKESWRGKDFAAHEHALASTVARTAGFDVLKDLHEAVRKAVVDRVPFEQFRKELTPKLQDKGWWGRQVRPDPKTGEKELVQLGSPRRLRTIYWANVSSAHAAGEWARTQATKDVLPYLQYKRSLAERRRPEHESWVGITLPVDHPWWRTHYPPNGWNCQCRVEQMGDFRADQAPPEKRRAPPLNPRLWKDKRTGKVWRVPEGIDPGWQRNPGYTRERVQAHELSRAIRQAAAPQATPADRYAAARTTVAVLRRTPEFEAMIARNLGYDPRQYTSSDAMRRLGDMAMPVAVAPDALIARASQKFGMKGIDPIIRMKVLIAEKQFKSHPALTATDYTLAQEALDGETHAAFSLTKADERVIEVSGGTDGREWMVVLRLDDDGTLWLISTFGPQPKWLQRFRDGQRTIDLSRRKM
jgi:Phage Mu protein F like protein